MFSLFRFVASCGFTPDVKVWEVCFGKTGDFREVTRAFELKGHSAGVHAFAFSNDSHRCDLQQITAQFECRVRPFDNLSRV